MPESAGGGGMPAGQEQLRDYQQLKSLLAALWGLLAAETVALLRDGVQEFVCWTVREAAGPGQLLEHLERAGLLSQNAVSILGRLCRLTDCGGGARLVDRFEAKYRLGSKEDRESRQGSTVSRPAAAAQRSPQPASSDSKGTNSQPGRPECFRTARDQQDWVSGGTKSDPEAAPGSEHGLEDWTIGEAEPGVLDWPRTEPGLTDWTIGETESSVQDWPKTGSGLRDWPQSEPTRPDPAETEQSRRESMAVWGHVGPSPPPRRSPSPPHVVCECHFPHPPAAPRRRAPAGLATTVQQVLDWRPARGGAGVTAAGERRARLVDFLSHLLGGRYLQLGAHLESISADELAALRRDTASDLVSSARRLLQLYLSRHGPDGVEQALSRRLRRAGCTRLADELDIWSQQQDRLEGGGRQQERLEDSRGRQQDRRGHPPPVRVPRMACC